MRLILEIDEPTPSLNEWNGSHWAVKHRLRDRWGWLIRAALSANRRHDIVAEATLKTHAMKGGMVSVSITRYGLRLLDEDNLHGGTKPARDALKAEGLIKDDRPAFTMFHVEQHFGDPPRTVIELAPL